jgi:lipid-A-disaccharide synthase
VKIFIVAGEPSGDQLGEDLVSLLSSSYPKIHFEGIGGYKMTRVGCKILQPINTLSVMGIYEIIKRLTSILILKYRLLKYIEKNKPSLYIGIDSPDFNLLIEKRLKNKHFKIIHYVSPSVWGWRSSRLKKIRYSTDILLTILPFEGSYYRKYKHKAIFVGHPLASKINFYTNKIDKHSSRKILVLNSNKVLFGFFPGSRVQEIKKMIPIFLRSIFILKKNINQLGCCISIAKSSLLQDIIKYNKILSCFDISLVHQFKLELALQSVDIALVSCGTATLEAALYKLPIVACYKLSGITATFLKKLVTTSFFSLPNIISHQYLIEEILQKETTPSNCANYLIKYLQDKKRIILLKKLFTILHGLLICNREKVIGMQIKQLIGKEK